MLQRLRLCPARHVVAPVEIQHPHFGRFVYRIGAFGMTQARSHLQQVAQGYAAARIAGALPCSDGGGIVQPQATVGHHHAQQHRSHAFGHGPAGVADIGSIAFAIPLGHDFPAMQH